MLPPCVIFEDEHLLVVNKPAGLNTHAPSPFAGQGLYEWLRDREPRWSTLAIIHRLDKETSGVLAFAKTPLANRSLTTQFSQRQVRKKYVLLSGRAPKRAELLVRSSLVRLGDKYVSRPARQGGEPAETRFHILNPAAPDERPAALAQTAPCFLVEAEPLTGRTHQIRVHAAEGGFPILGDTLYGGIPAGRVCLHALELRIKHPATNANLVFTAPVDFHSDAQLMLRGALVEHHSTNLYRVIHGASDRWPGWYVDRLGDWLLAQSEALLTEAQRSHLQKLMKALPCRGAYGKTLTRHVCKTNPAEASPQLLLGEPAPERFIVRENRLHYELSFGSGYSVGLFLDQRENRRRLLTRYVAPDFLWPQRGPLEVLNTFAYTCGFSVCAAKAGARTTSIDLSKSYLEWGKRNFELNRLSPAEHDFIYGDVFEWCRRLHKKGRRFDLVLLDPPTFSQSKQSGAFRARANYPDLVKAILPLLNPGGVLFASTNAADWPAPEFLESIEKQIWAGGRKLRQQHYIPQPPDFPVTRAEPGYLKTAWFALD